MAVFSTDVGDDVGIGGGVGAQAANAIPNVAKIEQEKMTSRFMTGHGSRR